MRLLLQSLFFVGALDKHKFSLGCNDNLEQTGTCYAGKYQCEVAFEITMNGMGGSEDVGIKNGAMSLQEVKRRL